MLFSALIAVLSLAAPDAVTQNIPPLSERVDVSIVEVDAVVVDRSGNPVRGLTADDFELFADGVSKPVSHFAEYRASSDGTFVEPPRSLLIFLERSRVGEYPRFHDAIDHFVADVVRPGDSASIVIWDDYAGLATVAVGYTSDSGLLRKRLRELWHGGIAPASDRKDVDRGRINSALRRRARDLSMNPAGDVWSHAAIAARRLELKIAAMSHLIEDLSQRPGRKVMLASVDRFSTVAGAEFFYSPYRQVLPTEAVSMLSSDSTMQRLSDAANAHGVAMFLAQLDGKPYDPKSGADEAQLLSPEAKFVPYLHRSNETPALARIASATGGRAAWAEREVIRQLPMVARSIGDYYSLAFRATPDASRVHTLQVRVRNPDYRVMARTRFMDMPERDSFDEQLRTALRNSTRNDLNASAGSPRRVGDDVFVVPLSLIVPAQWHDVSFLIAHRTILGDISRIVEEKRALNGERVVSFDVLVPADADRIGVGVIAGGTAIGLASIPIR